MNKRILSFLLLLMLIILFNGCKKDDSPSAPQFDDVIPANALTITDATGDLALAAEGPATVIPYDPVDVKTVRLWKSDGFLYIRFDFAGVIPSSSLTVSGQTVQQQGFNVSVDTDSNPATGASVGGIGGVDVFFAVLIRYGEQQVAPYANFNFLTPDIHTNTGHTYGEFRNGGQGYSYVTYRFALSSIGSLFSSNRLVVLGGWSEAASVQYHHFAFDDFQTITWMVP